MSPATELTPKQRKVLEFIEKRVRENIPPPLREIAAHMRFSSTGTVRDYLNALEKKGYLKRQGRLSRGVELLKQAFNKIPIIASIPAGQPSSAYEDIQGYIDPQELFPAGANAKEVFALRVKGDSMNEAGIMDGDIAVIRKGPAASNGDIVAALLENNEVTLKIFRRKQGGVFLEPANRNYSAIHKVFSVIGRLVGIVRKY